MLDLPPGGTLDRGALIASLKEMKLSAVILRSSATEGGEHTSERVALAVDIQRDLGDALVLIGTYEASVHKLNAKPMDALLQKDATFDTCYAPNGPPLGADDSLVDKLRLRRQMESVVDVIDENQLRPPWLTQLGDETQREDGPLAQVLGRHGLAAVEMDRKAITDTLLIDGAIHCLSIDDHPFDPSLRYAFAIRDYSFDPRDDGRKVLGDAVDFILVRSLHRCQRRREATSVEAHSRRVVLGHRRLGHHPSVETQVSNRCELLDARVPEHVLTRIGRRHARR